MEKNTSAKAILEGVKEEFANMRNQFQDAIKKVGCEEWKGYKFQPPTISVDMAEYAYNDFEPRKEDVFVISYPKTGTNWTIEVVRQILYPDPAEDEITKALPIPFKILEMEPKNKFEIYDRLQLKRRQFGSHLPAPLINMEKIRKANAKVVYVLRNPKDQLVSWYNFVQKFPSAQVEPLKSMVFQGWDNFFDHAVAGDFPMVNKPGEWYPEHILSWYPHRDNKTVYFVFYEDMKKDLCKEVKKLADFMDAPVSDERAQIIADACSFDAMKKAKTQGNGMEAKMAAGLMRKGGVGGWKDQLTVRQSERVDEIFAEKMKDTDIEFIYEL